MPTKPIRAQEKELSHQSFLSDDQIAFIEEYARDLNATRAVQRARAMVGQDATYEACKERGAKWMADPVITERIKTRLAELAKSRELTPQLLIDQLLPIALLDPRRIINWGPNGVVLHDADMLTKDDASAVSKISQTVTKEGGTLRVEFYDKLRAIELLGRYLQMWNDKELGNNDLLGELATWSEDRLRARMKELVEGRGHQS